MAKIQNYARDVETGVPFTAGNAEIYGPDGTLLASPALDGTTGRWSWQANGSPGKTRQRYSAAGQVKIVEGDAAGQAGNWFELELERIMGLFTPGVVAGCAVTAPGGMQVQVGAGDILNAGILHPIYTAENVSIAAAHATLPRIDVIVSRLTKTGTFAGRLVLGVVQGTAAASPAVPALTNDANTGEVELARVNVPAAAGAIVLGNISTATRPGATAAVADNSITNAKLADDSVGAAEIINGSVGLAELAAGLTLPFLAPGLISTYWLPTSGLPDFGSSTELVVANTLYGAPIFIPKATTITGAAIQRIAGSSAAATARIGLYNAGSNGLPTTLHTDFGTLNVSTAGVKQAAVASVPVAAGWYWAATVFGTFTGTLSAQVTVAGRPMLGLPAAGAASANYNVFTQGVWASTASLPTPYPAPGLGVFAPQMWIQTSGS